MKISISLMKWARQVIAIGCLLFSFTADAQIVEAWVQRHNEALNYYDDAVDIAVDPQGNVYITGITTVAFPEEYNTRYENNIITIKYNSKGQQLWKRIYDNSQNLSDGAVAMKVDAQGNVYITGGTELVTDNTDILTLKYNTEGVLQWASVYNGPANTNDLGNTIALDEAGNVYVAGVRDGDIYLEGTDIVVLKYNANGVLQSSVSYAGALGKRDDVSTLVVPGNGYVYLGGGVQETDRGDFLIIKYNTSLDVQWIQTYDGYDSSDWCNDIVVDVNGNVYATGTSMGNGTNYDMLTLKIDPNGNHLWNKRYHNTQRDGGWRVRVDASGNVIACGGSLAHQDDDIVTAKYTKDGAEVWIRRYATDDGCNDDAYDMELDAAGNVYITGYSNKPGKCSFYTDYVTLKYIPNGDRAWVKKYPGPAYPNRAHGIALDHRANVFVTGISMETLTNPTNGYGDHGIATIKYARCVINVPADIVVNNAPGKCGDSVIYAPATTSGDCGELQYSQASNTFFPVGTTTVTVSSPATGETATFTVTVLDVEKPVITCPADISVSCAANVPAVNTAAVTATDNCGTPTVTHVSDVISNKTCDNRFTLTRTYKATDAAGNFATCTQVITVYDDVAPQISNMQLSQVSMWPPNHTMRDITVSYDVTDNCVSNPAISIAVTSNEPINGTADGDTDPDWEIIDNHHIRLRAERASNGTGRVYTITVTVNDGCNPAVSQSRQVIVAHNITSPQTGHPFKVGTSVPFNGVFWDKPGNTHTAKWLLDGSAVTNGSVTEPQSNTNGKVSGSYKFTTPGVYKLQMNVTDQSGVTSYVNTNNDLDAIVVIYDPNGGNAYGGGWFASPAGALVNNVAATGKASYGFAVNYRNAAKPKGETQFEFKVGSFEFNALNFDYLSIGDYKAQFKGTGKIIGGQSGIGFTMTVIDGALDGSGVDRIRMKIYNRNTGFVYYDNQPGAGDAEDPVTVVGSNSLITIQKNSTAPVAGMQIESQPSGNIMAGKFEITVFPNPSNQEFTLQARSNDQVTKLQVEVYDPQGRLVEKKGNINVGTTFKLGGWYKPGVYVVKIKQGENREVVKLVKL